MSSPTPPPAAVANPSRFGSNRLILGDCFTHMAGTPSGTYDGILTDPPFGQGELVKYGRNYLVDGSSGTRGIATDGHLEWLPQFAREAYRVLKQNAHCVVYWQWRTYPELLQAFTGAGFELKTLGVWDKKMSGLGRGLAEGYEQIAFFRKGAAREHNFRSNVFRFSRVHGRPRHPHQKPINLHRAVLETVSAPGAHFYDPFGGIFTAGLACLHAGMRYTGVEIKGQYYEMGVKDFAKCYDVTRRQLSLITAYQNITQPKLAL